MTEREPIFIEPATQQEGFARLVSATLYRQNPGIPFFECGLVEQEIRNLQKWCRAALRPPTAKEIAAGIAERRARWEARKAAQAVTQ